MVVDVPAAPLIAFGFGWASHYVLDAVPHWERLYLPRIESGFTTQLPVSKWPRHVVAQAFLDVLVAIGLLAVLIYKSDTEMFLINNPIFWGGIGGFFPDAIDNFPLWNNFFGRIFPFKYFQNFHQRIHISDQKNYTAPRYLGLITQIIVVAVGVYLIVN